MKNENENESHDKSVQQIQHHFHEQHPLVLVAEQSNEGLKAHCHGCGELLSTPCFTCIRCNYHLHKQCAEALLEIPNHPLHPTHSDTVFFLRQRPNFDDDLKCLDELPTKIDHPSHHIHPLFLNYNNRNHFCNLCQKEHSGAFYGCSLCHFNIDVGCAWPRSIIEDKSHHQHPFTLFWRQDSFICDACGTKGNYISYICITRQDCKICFKEVRLERGSYSCVKQGCNYVVHVNCVLEHRRLYKVIEEEKQCEELEEKSMQSSIIHVIEVNEAGEATKIQHFSHQHSLVLADKMEEEIDRKCDGCMLPISNIFYYCSECPLFLHKTCVEFPRIKQHYFKCCNFCNRFSSGFFYKTDHPDMCLRCAKVANIIECEGHQHFLFFDFKCMEKCNGCGDNIIKDVFRCGKCRFALDFECLTLPHSALHKIDEHKLKLTYHDDKGQSYCDICEQYRDPSLWYYSCSIYDTSAHIKCVLGQFSFLKNGVTFPSQYYHNHYHDLKFSRKVEGFLDSSRCGKFCQEEIFKCEKSTCSYIINCKCH
uniref:Phorbol-ester/DAG-type domain-containing protein n=1 Tax=Gossypium raimondii TaxID=29730 RepID=A0A0D2SLJ0_GOSRA|nr:hypothetical protein B456_N006100 [Gossypium raimondii]